MSVKSGEASSFKNKTDQPSIEGAASASKSKAANGTAKQRRVLRSRHRPKITIPPKLKQVAETLKLPQAAGAIAQIPKLSYKGRSIYRYKRFWLAVLGVGAGGTLAWGYWTIEQSLPSTGAINQFVRTQTLTIKAMDGSVIQQTGPATRETLTYKQIPPLIVNAFVAAEDRRFYQHNGIDYQSILRAMATNILARDVVEGASTITQQLARIVYLNQDRNLDRKIREAMMAQKIDRELSKEQILERYLNLVYLGSEAYGVADAAWVYFSKPINKLTLAEAATIAGLPPAPSEYSPLVDKEKARQRRDIVLGRMQEQGFITAIEADAAKAEDIKLKPSIPKRLYSEAPSFTSYIRQELPKYVSKDELEVGGLTIETTLNPKWQKKAEEVINSTVANEGYYEAFGQAALVTIDSGTGEIRAMVGGYEFKEGQFNRATQAQRQPGSSFKGILYTAAIATGLSPYDGYLDAPFVVDGYRPKNANRKYSGWMSLRDALTNSVNVVSVKVLIDTGFDPVIKLAQQMGIKSKLLPTYSLALGASEVNLLELTNAYATLANQGKYIPAHGIRRVLNRQGKVIYDASFKPKQVVDKTTAAIISWMMQSVVNSGTGQPAQLDRQVAGKTGTSEEARDLWFVGFIPQLATGVWLGNDDNLPTWSASTTAAAVWHDFMVSATKGIPVKYFPELPNVDGRKGSIKAKPISPSSSYTASYDSDESAGGSRSGSSGSSYDNSSSYSSGGSGSYSDSGSSSSDGNSGAAYQDSAPSEAAPPPEAAPPSAADSAPVEAPAGLDAPIDSTEPAPPPATAPAPPPAPGSGGQ
ncbi:transglycosylase domain-containing protein [Pantanalinema sp. GBBB05]|uniref:transglycosylase domain-containing protein n=1 Tax=Pantanalinema sp. GBBB05 TaxID=2604139 RepID=UPI003D818EA0